jgi:hyperosmotically inducible periplasmic protein
MKARNAPGLQEEAAIMKASQFFIVQGFRRLDMRKTLILTVPLIALLAGAQAFAKPQMSNAQITAAIQDKLYHANVFKHGDVQVTYDNGMATLAGTLDSLGEKNDALKAVRKVEGVREVVDNIAVRAEDVSPSQIVEQARHEIVTYPFYTIFDNLVLQSNGDKLIVSGQVTQPYKKADIGNILAHVKGVAELQNDLQVLPVSNFDDQVRVAIARAIYRDPYFIAYGNQALPPIHIIVDNGHVTLEGVVNRQVDRAKAEVDARFAATYFSLTDNLRVEKS